VPLERLDDRAELVRDVQLVRVEEEEDEVAALGEPAADLEREGEREERERREKGERKERERREKGERKERERGLEQEREESEES